MKKNAGIVLAMILYAFLAVGIVFVIYIGGTYPVGADAMSHVYTVSYTHLTLPTNSRV